ncbi:unnamed protein product [Heterobilharzia americana]|nr:unnamed protein product [Heterobilharzia americana]
MEMSKSAKLPEFWYNTVREPSGRIFLRPDVFINTEYTIDEFDAPEEKALNELFTVSSNQSYRVHGSMEGFEGSRVMLIATILVNLVTPPPVVYPSVGEDDDDELDFGPISPCSLFPNGIPLATWRDNARVIAASPNALRFVFLCAHAYHSGLKSLGLQLLSSIRYPLDPPSVPLPLDCPDDWTPLIDNGCRLAQLTLTFLTRCILESNDRCDLIAGLMFLANLTKVREKVNLPSLIIGLPQTVWPRLAQLLCLPDLAIVCAALEAVRCLTDLDATTCLACWESCCSSLDTLNDGNIPFILLQPLLALLTLEGQAMGSQSLHRIRLLPRNPQPQNVQSQFSHGFGLRTPAHCRPPPNVNGFSRSRDASYINGQTFKTYIYPKSPPKVHSVSSDSYANDRHNSANSVLNLKLESSTPLKPSAVIPTSCIAQPVYRPQSGSTACSGLINLLSSIPSSSSSSNVGLSVASSASPNPVPATPKLTTPSLSELTDRLQMPPPSLPPPSALRRSGKWAHSRTSLISSPQLTNKSKINSPTSPPCRTNYSSGNVAERITSSFSPIAAPANLKSSCPSGNSTTSDTLINSKDIESSVQSGRHILYTDTCEKLSNNSLIQIVNNSQNSLPHLNPILNYDDCNDDNQHHIDKDLKTTPLQHNDYETKPIINGDLNCIDDIESKSYMNSLHTNGLRTGILQEAVLAIQDKKFKHSSEQSKSTIKYINGMLDGKHEVVSSIKINSNVNAESDVAKAIHFEDYDIHESEKNCHLPTTKEDVSSNSRNRLVKTSNIINCHRLHPSHRFLKRRRKWGSKNKLFTPKRRRDLINLNNLSKTVSTTCLDTSTALNTALKMNSVPGSVLDPTWRPTDESSTKPVITGSGDGTVESTCSDFKSCPISPEPNNTSETNECRSKESCESVSESTNTNHSVDVMSSTALSTPGNMEKPGSYLCEWECCTSTFEFKHQVAHHVYSMHLPNKESWKVDSSHHPNHKYPVQIVRRCCRWRGCQSASLARAPYALMTHVLDMHCSPKELEQRRSNHEHKKVDFKTLDTRCDHFNNDTNLSPGDVHPEYLYVGDRSAWTIIRSVEAKSMQNDLCAAQHHFLLTNPHYQPNLPLNPLIHSSVNNPPREGPVTKHLRVTSALILKNLVTHVEQARKWLLKESQLLSEIAFGCTPSETGLRTNNAGQIIAQCLSICTLEKPTVYSILSPIMQQSVRIPLSGDQAYRSSSSFSSSIQPIVSTVNQQMKLSSVDLDSDVCN